MHTGVGDDRIYVSSRADVPLTADRLTPDYLFGDLSLIGGTLNIDAGTGRQTLMISDEAGQAGRTALITGTRPAAATPRAGREPRHPAPVGERAGRPTHLPRRPRRPRDQLRGGPDRQLRRRHLDLGRLTARDTITVTDDRRTRASAP